MKTRPVSLLARLLALSLVLGAAACSGAAPAAPGASLKAAPAASQRLWPQIEAEIGDAACDAADQCRTLAVGNRPCGGPERYVAWSARRSDAARLAALGAQYAAARKADNEREGLISTCQLITDPGATCSAGHCVLRKDGAGASVQ